MSEDANVNNDIELKSIGELFEFNFFVDDYQRGYKWTSQQVLDLLNDINDFQKGSGDKDGFYCLQPLVVKKRDDDSYEVIDGQQRLTTIYLILQKISEPTENKFVINYQTRKKSATFLNEIKTFITDKYWVDGEKISNDTIKEFEEKIGKKWEDFVKKGNEEYDNIDNYHFFGAYLTIQNWFDKKTEDDLEVNFKSKLKNNTEFIWYEVDKDDDSIDVFTRLNTGKISLTNSELIKALFLSKAKGGESETKVNYKQLQIASEWDTIETTLQNDSFWYFIYHKKKKDKSFKNYDTRIEYIFDLMKKKSRDDAKYYTFHKFLSDFNEKKEKSENIWSKIKKYFLTFEGWYHDRELYHLIGFLISINYDVKKIKDESSKNTKIKFKEYLKKIIKDKLKFKKDDSIDNIGYGNKLIKPLLLLFNIQTMLQNEHSKSRFPFDSYKKDGWDIEHIHSQTDIEFKGDERKNWLSLVLEYYTGKEKLAEQKEVIKDLGNGTKQLCEKITNFEGNDNEFMKLKLELIKLLKIKDLTSTHGFGNLALLDAGTNRSYKNAFFPIKRMKIMQREKEGSFVPIATKNVFMKAYSRKFDNIMSWDESDAENYLSVIKETLSDYFPEEVQ